MSINWDPICTKSLLLPLVDSLETNLDLHPSSSDAEVFRLGLHEVSFRLSRNPSAWLFSAGNNRKVFGWKGEKRSKKILGI